MSSSGREEQALGKVDRTRELAFAAEGKDGVKGRKHKAQKATRID